MFIATRYLFVFASILLIGAGCNASQPTPQVEGQPDPTQYFVMMRAAQGSSARGEAHIIKSNAELKLIGQFSLDSSNASGALVCGGDQRPIGPVITAGDLASQRFTGGPDFLTCSEYVILDGSGEVLLRGTIDREVGYFGDDYWR